MDETRKTLYSLCGYSESRENVRLMCYREGDTIILSARYDGKVELNSFNTSTGELVENIAWLCKDVCNIPNMYSDNNQEILDFCSTVFLASEYNRQAIDNCSFEQAQRCLDLNKLYYLMCHNQGLLESILKTETFALRTALDSIDVKQKSIKKAIVYSSDIIDWFKAMEMGSYINEFAKCLSNDEMKIFIKFTTHAWFKKHSVKAEFTRGFLNLARVVKDDEGIRIVDILRYLLRQTYFHTSFNYNMLERTMRSFKDYTKMRLERKAVGAERFPSDIYKAHDLMASNAYMFSRVNNAEYNAGVKSYSKQLSAEFKVNGVEYIVLAPETMEELFQEGSYLHHCVASYAELIANKETAVMLLRKKEEQGIPWITLEVKNGKVIQACGNYNEDVMVSAADIIKEYERRI